MTNVLITGITGMVGSHLADYLLKKTEWKIYGFCRWNDNLENIEHLSSLINSKERIELVYGDLNDTASLISAISKSKPDYVFHLAAQSYPQTSFDTLFETLDTNIIGTAKLLEMLWRDEDINPIAGEYYNIGGSYSCSIKDMLNYLISQSTVKGIKVVTDKERLRPIDADLQVPNTKKFTEHTGWEPQISFEETMNDLLQYWRDKVNSGRKFLRR